MTDPYDDLPDIMRRVAAGEVIPGESKTWELDAVRYKPDHPLIFWLIGTRLAKWLLPGRTWARIAWWAA